ncbi:MAG: MotA/TolQ/ExbB proton channel [Oscillospiraceae bacterium]|nr:MotA/TolQ/ExbB proton channel [Oscillospiraceae bacterium]
MNIAYLIGIIVGFGGIVFGYLEEEGVLSSLIKISAAAIVFGGTFGIMFMGNPMSRVKQIPKAVRVVFTYKPRNYGALVDQLFEIANIARRDGLLALEAAAEKSEDAFIQKGLNFLADGVEPDFLRDVLSSEIDAKDRELEGAAAVFEGMGGTAPTMGVLGTVMGMVSILRDMSDMDTLGGKIATAFIATMYGVGSANLLWLPMASHIKSVMEMEREYFEVIIDGLLLIQDGVAPSRLRESLEARIGGDNGGKGKDKDAVAEK